MSNFAEESGEPKIDMRLYLGELASAKPGVRAPDRPKATPIRHPEPERSPAVSFAWARPLRASSNTVQFATEQVCA